MAPTVLDRLITALTERYGAKLPGEYHLGVGYAVLNDLHRLKWTMEEQRRVARAFGVNVMPLGHLHATRKDPHALVVLDGPPAEARC